MNRTDSFVTSTQIWITVLVKIAFYIFFNVKLLVLKWSLLKYLLLVVNVFLGQESKKFQLVKFLVLLMSNHNIRPAGIITLFYFHSVILLRGDVRE